MKILQILSYVDQDASYGGPLSVAVRQCEGLAELGHEVTLLAGWDGSAKLALSGAQVKLHRAYKSQRLGFGSVTSPSLVVAASRRAKASDVVHVHLGRDLAALPAGLAASRFAPTILQTHGMINRPNDRAQSLIDWAMTDRLFDRAASVLTLTPTEEQELGRVIGRTLPIQRLENFAPTVAWRASFDTGTLAPEVVFVARLHERKRPLDFVRMAATLHRRGATARFSLIGPDEGQRHLVDGEIRRLGMEGIVRATGPIDASMVPQRLSEAQVFVLPSVNEPYPVTVLEALAVGLPSVITTETGISHALRDAGAARVVAPDPEALAGAVETILGSREVWDRLSTAALDTSRNQFSRESGLSALETLYGRAAAGTGS